ncbi:Zinc finger, C3HC4 type (RING finger) [Musa troglodytarum]|uniref:RING-type E3 ubiquitin transferase n=1 Tax=Musa troglodytarum TaxID=320322 RepID=A0A9E7JCJ9_9LILI|nr:Zinc finger, C3HC4 type (RING finger) [Musa troglodytarum]
MDVNHGGDLTPNARRYALSGKVMFASTVGLFAAVLFLVFLYVYFPWRFRLIRRDHRRLVFAIDGVGGTLASASATCRGLHPTVLESLPVLVFSAAPGCDEDVVECAVCLNELEEGEKMRALPRCGHCFHMECIDMWFHSHSTCPLCRTAVETAPPPPPPPPPIQVLLPIPAPTDDSGALFREDDASESSSVSRDLRIEVPARETEGDLRLGLKSPGSWMLSLTSLLSRDSMVCCGRETATELERDPERGEGAATGPPPRRPSSA